MSIGDWIDVVLCILSFGLAVISVITVIITLRQNSKMIEAENRPYIAIYGQQTNFSSPQYYLAIKNFGKCGGTIKKIVCDVDLQKYSYVSSNTPFKYIENTMIMPNQNIVCSIDHTKLEKDKIELIRFDVTYTFADKEYSEKCIINYKVLSNNVLCKSSSNDKELHQISYTLQDMAQKQL